MLYIMLKVVIYYVKGLVVLVFAVAVAVAYLYNKHWLANNIIGLCFAIQVLKNILLKNLY